MSDTDQTDEPIAWIPKPTKATLAKMSVVKQLEAKRQWRKAQIKAIKPVLKNGASRYVLSRAILILCSMLED